MARLNDDERETILADWHTGEYSKNELAKKHNTSHTTINKITKDIEPKHKGKVSTLVSVKRELSNASFKEVSAIETLVDDRLRRESLVYSIQEKALAKAETMLDQIDSPSDLKTIVEAVDKASITLKVSDRHAKSGDVNVNATAAVQNVVNKSLDDFYEE